MRSVVKSFVKLSSTYAIGNLASNALNFVFIPLYTTYLSVVDYGIVALMTVTVSLVTIFISAPITSAFSRYYYAPEYKGRNGSLLFSLLIVLFVKSTLLAIAFYSLSTILAEKLLDDPNHVAIIQLYSVILFFQPFRNFFQTLIQMLEKARYFVVISLLGLGFIGCINSVSAHRFATGHFRPDSRQSVYSCLCRNYGLSCFPVSRKGRVQPGRTVRAPKVQLSAVTVRVLEFVDPIR